MRDNPTMTTFVCFELLLWICMAMISWRRRLHIFSTFLPLTASKETPQNFKLFTWTTFQKLKTCCSSIFSYMILISLTENSLVNLLVEAFKNMTKMSHFYATAITPGVSGTSTRYLKLSGALLVSRFFQKGNPERYLVTCSESVTHIYPKKVYKLRETPFDKLDDFRFPTKRSKRCSKLWLFLILSQFVLKKTHTRRQRLQSGSGSMYRYQFLFGQIWSKNLFSFAIPRTIISSHLL